MRDRGQVLLVAQPDERGMVGRGGQLDVDRATGRARAQVLVGDVAVVLPGADHARGEVVGAQEVEEVRVAEAPVGAEQPLGQVHAVASRDPLHELGRGGPLQVDVQLGLRDGRHRAAKVYQQPVLICLVA